MWQPIETMPQDGTEVLLSDGSDVCLGSMAIIFRDAHNGDPSLRYLNIHAPDGARFESECEFKPTLWAPVPPLPQKS